MHNTILGGELFTLVLLKCGTCLYSGYNENIGVKKESVQEHILTPGFGMVPSSDGGIKLVAQAGQEEFLALDGKWRQLSGMKMSNIYANASSIYIKLRREGAISAPVMVDDTNSISPLSRAA